MFELTINGKVYQFHFGMGFMREANKKYKVPVGELKNVEKNIGLQLMIGDVIDGNIETLVELLEIANKGHDPRLTRDLLDQYIDDENTDIDGLFETVIDFLRKTNATKKLMKMCEETIAAEKAKQAAK